MSTKAKNPNWGGARSGSGPKKETLSVRQVREILESVKKRAELEGKTVTDVFLDIVYDLDASRRDRLAAGKLIWEYTIAKLQEGGETDRAFEGPAVFLPAEHPRLEMIKGGKKDGDK